MRLSILLFVLLVLLPVVVSEEIHEEWHPYHDLFTIGEDYYEVEFQHVESGSSMLVRSYLKRNQASYIFTATGRQDENDDWQFSVPGCEREGLLKFCLVNVSLEPEKGARSDDHNNYRYGTKLIFYEEPPDAAYLEVERETVEVFNVGVDQRVRVHITNIGNKSARDVNVTEIIDRDLRIADFGDFDIMVGNKLKKNIPLIRSGEEVTLDYRIAAQEYVNKTFLATDLSYSAPDLVTKTFNDSYNIPFPYTTSMSFSKTSAKIYEPFTLTYSFKNVEIIPLQLSVGMDLPGEFVVNTISKPFTRQDNRIVYSGTLEPDETLTLTVNLESPYTGSYEFAVDAYALINTYTLHSSQVKTMTIKNDKITPSLLPSKEKTRSGEPLIINYYVRNEDDQVTFYDVKGWVGSSWFNESYAVQNVPPDSARNPIFKTLIPPQVSVPTDFIIYAKGSFTTLNGEVERFSTQKTVQVIPKELSVIMTQSVNTTSLSRGDELTVTVSVENVADSGYKDVSAADTFTEGLEVSFGSSQAVMTLFGGEEKQMYLYKLRVPFDWTQPTFEVLTTMTVQGQAVSTKLTTITVADPLDEAGLDTTPPPDVVVPDTPSTPSAPGVAPDVSVDPDAPSDEVPSQGFFSQILSGIGDFFRNFFS